MRRVLNRYKLMQSLVLMLIVSACNSGYIEENKAEPQNQERHHKFHVLYPQPTDPNQFDLDYAQHLDLLDSIMGYSQDKPYSITKMDREAFGAPAPFYQMFTMSFETREKLETTIYSKEMEEAGKDAMRISSGGAPVVLIGED